MQRPRHHRSYPGGRACSAALQEVVLCAADADCEVSEWTQWDACDKTCGGGQQTRQRQVVRNPEAGGRMCPSELIELRGCSQAPCDRRDCAVSDWAEWSTCAASCGSGQQERSRRVTQQPRE